MARRGEAPKKKKRSVLFLPMAFIAICLAIAFGMSVFFRVSVIEVEGAVYYSEKEIIAAAAIEEGDNLFFLNRLSAISRICSKLPYIEEASVSRHLPNRVVITVSEAVAMAYIEYDGQLWLIDRGCKALEALDGDDAAGYIKISGLTADEPVIGEALTSSDAETAAKLDYLASILSMLQSKGMHMNISEININNIANPSLEYLGRFTVKLGAQEELDYKLELLLSTVEKIADTDSGTLDLSIDKKAYFIPD